MQLHAALYGTNVCFAASNMRFRARSRIRCVFEPIHCFVSNNTLFVHQSSSERCAVCTDTVARYCCPRCGLRTCSVACVHRHKAATGCNGRRDVTGYVGRAQYAEQHLLSDYRFLEGVDHVVDSVQRFRQNLGRRPPRFLDEVQTLLLERDAVQLKLAPPGMSRRLVNRTRFNRKTKVVQWTLELVLLADNSSTADDDDMLDVATDAEQVMGESGRYGRCKACGSCD